MVFNVIGGIFVAIWGPGISKISFRSSDAAYPEQEGFSTASLTSCWSMSDLGEWFIQGWRHREPVGDHPVLVDDSLVPQVDGMVAGLVDSITVWSDVLSSGGTLSTHRHCSQPLS